ncbi:MAG: hypothetical protein OEX81_03170 [Candidatus Pacebacteria bacterium]|nr:hypothetical protein [Candidatus Paceibacterota bacterium]
MMIFNLLAAANFGPTGLQPQGGTTEGIANFDTATPLTSLELWISRLLGMITTIGAIVFIFMFFYGAFRWLSGGDDTAKIGKARDQMVQGVIGMIIMVAGYAIIGLIGEMIGIDILNPAQQIRDVTGITGN